MDRLAMQSKDIAKEKLELFVKLFPNAISETVKGYDEQGNAILERTINVEALSQELSCMVSNEKEERYQFTWPNKRQTIRKANEQTTNTLRPCKDSSVDFERTENIYIEGDNLEVLKILQETYLERIKIIYIDPPYNTGNDFIYNDNYVESAKDYLDESGQVDKEGNRLVHNSESNGRFHTDWLNMMYPRLKLARNLLAEDGAIFISIDDNELDKLKMICDEIFGQQNFVGIFTWIKTTNPPSLGSKVRDNMEYILCYEKKYSASQKLYGRESNQKDSPLANASNKINTVTIPAGTCFFGNLNEGTVEKGYKESDVELLDDVVVSEGMNRNDFRIIFRSKWGQENIYEEVKNGTTFMIKDYKYFSIRYVKGNIDYVVPDKYLDASKFDVRDNEYGRKEVEELLGKVGFDYPKNTPLIATLIKMYTKNEKDAIILDFFSGSGTTAHAVMKLNEQDGGSRKFIMVQLPEHTKEDSAAKEAGYETICEIGKARIKCAAESIAKASKDENFDKGFRVLKLDSSNMKDVYYTPEQIQQQLLFDIIDNIKEERTPEDLLFQVMLDLGVLLSSKIEEKVIAGKRVFYVADGFLIACFDKDVTEDTVTAVAKEKPRYAVFRDSSMANDSVATNFEQIFATYSPETIRKVL